MTRSRAAGADIPVDLRAARHVGGGGIIHLCLHFLVERVAVRLYLSAKAAKIAPALAVIFMEGYDVPYGKIIATSTLIAIPVLICAVK